MTYFEAVKNLYKSNNQDDILFFYLEFDVRKKKILKKNKSKMEKMIFKNGRKHGHQGVKYRNHIACKFATNYFKYR